MKLKVTILVAMLAIGSMLAMTGCSSSTSDQPNSLRGTPNTAQVGYPKTYRN